VRRRPDARWLALCVIFVTVLAQPAAAAAPALGLSARTVPPGSHITVTFELARPATVVFSITRTDPARRRIGVFEVRGRRGANRFLFPGRFDRRLLRPGTYRLTAEIDGARAVSPTFRVVAAVAHAPKRESSTLRTLVVLFVLLAIPLLAVGALPGRVVPGARGPELITAGRPGLVAAGFTALAAAFALYVASVL
jgi:hypothetical protein